MNDILGDRSTYIGASDIPIILGISPFVTPYRLWLYKTKREEPKTNEWMTYGTNMESQAREKYIEQIGINVEIEKEFSYYGWPWLKAHPDGISKDGKIIVEIKCPVKKESVDCWSFDNEVPEHYYVQCQAQLLCTGAEECHFYGYHPECDPVLISVKPDKSYFETILQAAQEFLVCVEKDVPPPTTEKDYIKIDDPDFDKYAEKYIAILEEEKKLDSIKKEIREQLLDFTDDGNCYGGGLKIFKSMPKKIVDWKGICDKYEIDESKMKPFTKYGNSFYTIRQDS